jgi:hypothetical protein
MLLVFAYDDIFRAFAPLVASYVADRSSLSRMEVVIMQCMQHEIKEQERRFVVNLSRPWIA